MATKKSSRANPKKLFEQMEDFTKSHPDLNKTYSQFLEDLAKYRESQKSQEKRQEFSDYIIFGASFQE